MKNILFLAVFPFLFFSCGEDFLRDISELYIVDNRTNKTIVFDAEVWYTSFSPMIFHEQNCDSVFLSGKTLGQAMLNSTIYNITDTTKINISVNKFWNITHYNKLESQNDTIINDHISYENCTLKWIITNNLLKIMEKDYSMIQLFPEFYMYE